MRLTHVFTAMMGFAAIGCVDGPEVASTDQSLSGIAVINSWGNQIATWGTQVPENALRTTVRIEIAQLAMFDAVNAALDGPYEPFASRPSHNPGASAEAAAVRAAYVVASNEFPTLQASIDSFYASSVAGLGGSQQEIDDGLAVGQVAGEQLLIARANDNRNIPDQTGYVPGTAPGYWRPTPGGTTNPQTPFLRFVTPFGFDDPARFRPIAPPSLISQTYTDDYNEIKDVGSATNTSRTAAQSATAQFWSGSASGLWIANARTVAGSMDILTGARFEGLAIGAITNNLITTWDSKYEYMYWRPVSGIREGANDGNIFTTGDPTWTPFITTPSHPEYLCAHCTGGAAALGVYAYWYGTDTFPLDFKGTGGATRHYENIDAIHEEESNARVWGGMHWRHSTEVGTRVGNRVGHYTATHMLKDLSEGSPHLYQMDAFDIWGEDCEIFVQCLAVIFGPRGTTYGAITAPQSADP
jgi:hypothetical protein